MWFLAAVTVLGAQCRLAGAVVIRGVAPEEQSKYSRNEFRCFDGSSSILPATVVNDEFCDCADGSDEPGTGACAGLSNTLFFCVNEGSVSKRIFASQVGDGLCDCCDGSDEASLLSRTGSSACSDECAVEGKQLLEEFAKRAGIIKRGVKKQQEIQAAAVAERAAWREELRRLKMEKPILEEKLADARERAEAIGAVEHNEGAEASSDSGEEPQTFELAAEASTIDAKAATDPSQGEEKPQVSEYARWMEGAESALDNQKDPMGETAAEDDLDSGAQHELDDEPRQEGTDSELDNEGEEDEEEEDEDEDDWVPYTAANVHLNLSRDPTYVKRQGQSKEVQEAMKTVRENEARAKELTEKLEILSEERLGYASLLGKTLHQRIGGFDYKITFFSKAQQGHTSLGTWQGFTGSTSAKFEDGASCWQGPNRQLRVTFKCGVEESIAEVVEPSRCVYAATVIHPGACDPTEIKRLDVGTRVTGPGDEL